MTNNNKTVKEPFLHIVKRSNISLGKKISIYAIAIISSLLIGGIICSLVSPRGNVFKFFITLFEGCFGTERLFWLLQKVITSANPQKPSEPRLLDCA